MTRQLLALVIAGVAAVVLSACGSAAGAGRGAVAPCGGERPPALGWRCAFDDEFSGRTVDVQHWRVVRTAVTGFRAGGECLLGGRHVAVADGALRLMMTTQEPPVTCGSASSPYASGMVSTYRAFAQRYGRFAVRARMAAGQGVQSAIWLMPEASTYGPWPRSGEIDLAESYGNAPDAIAPHVHYLDATGAPAAPGTTCAVSGRGGLSHLRPRLEPDCDLDELRRSAVLDASRLDAGGPATTASPV